MTNITAQRTIHHYCIKNGLNRYIMNMMSRFVKYRLNHLHGVMEDAAIASKIAKNLKNNWYSSLNSYSYIENLISVSAQPDVLKANIKRASSKHVAAQEVISAVAAQYHFSNMMEKIVAVDGTEAMSPEQIKVCSDEAWANIAKHIEGLFDILANEDEIYDSIQPALVCELTKAAENNAEFLNHPLNMKRVFNKLGLEGLMLAGKLHTIGLTLAQKAIEANENSNDYDSE